MLGSGAVIVIDDRCCMVQLGLRVAQFYMHESCGKCTPCREGTRWMVQLLRKIEEGDATQGELDVLLDVCDRILGNCLCPLGDAAAMPVASYVASRDEYQRHIDEGRCPSAASRRSRACSRRSTSTTRACGTRSRCPPRNAFAPVCLMGHPGPPPAFEPNGGKRAHGTHRAGSVAMNAQPQPELVTVTIDGHELQAPKRPGDGRGRGGGWDRDPSSATSPAGRRSGPAACASASGGAAEAPGRLHAHGHGRPGPQDGADEREGLRRASTRFSSSSSSTTLWTAPTATRRGTRSRI